MFYAGTIIGENLYYSDSRKNGLFRISINNGEVSFLSFFSAVDLLQTNIHCKCVAYKNQLFFFPGSSGTHIHIYNLKNTTMSYIDTGFKYSSLTDVYIQDNKLWIIPHEIEGIIRIGVLNTDCLDIHYLNISIPEELRRLIKSHEQRFSKRTVFDFPNVWIALAHTSFVLRINLIKYDCEFYYLDIDDIYGIYKTAKGFWITSFSEEYIFRWNSQDNISVKCPIADGHIKGSNISNNIVDFSDETYAIPSYSDSIMRYNDKEGLFIKAYEYPEGFKFERPDYSKFAGFSSDDRYIVLFPFNAKKILLIDKKLKQLSSIYPYINADYSKEPYASYASEYSKDSIYENSDFCLNDYLGIV